MATMAPSNTTDSARRILRAFRPPFTEAQQKALAIVPKITSFPSVLGALFIVQHVIRSPARRSKVYYRILMAMSLHDIICSLKTFLSTWPIPADVPDVYGNIGTTQTCVAAGFLGQGTCLTSSVYNGTLTLYFLVSIRFAWKEHRIRRQLEWFLHALPLLTGWSTAIAALLLDLYNPLVFTCWFNTYPSPCGEDGMPPCERGGDPDTVSVYRWAFFHAELWTVFAFVSVALYAIYCGIRKREIAMDRYRPEHALSGSGRDLENANIGRASRFMKLSFAHGRRKSSSLRSNFGNDSSRFGTRSLGNDRLSSDRLSSDRLSNDRLSTGECTGEDDNGACRGEIRVDSDIAGGDSDDMPNGEGDEVLKESTAAAERAGGAATRAQRLNELQTQKQEQQRKKILLSRRFATQACLYVAAFFVSWIFPMIQWVVTHRTGEIHTPWFFLVVIFAPLQQGFFNFLIYIRPLYLNRREKSRQRKLREEQFQRQEQERKRKRERRQQQRQSSRACDAQVISVGHWDGKDDALSSLTMSTRSTWRADLVAALSVNTNDDDDSERSEEGETNGLEIEEDNEPGGEKF